MPGVHWWDKAGVKDKERAIRVLNGEVTSLGPIRFLAIPRWAEAQRRAKLGLPTSSVDRQVRKDHHTYAEHRKQLQTLIEWRDGGVLPPDVRRCMYKPCSRFFHVANSRTGKVYHSEKCGRNFRSSKCMNTRIRAARERKLRRVKAALKLFRHLPDWKERTAGRARVTRNFVSYALRRGEIK